MTATATHVRAAFFVVEGLWAWYRRNWKATAVTSVVQPVLFLVAFGVGFGSQVTPGTATGGLPYLVYLTPALLVATTVNIASFESTYPVLGGFKWQSGYVAMAATPMSPAQIACGQLTWISIRLTSSGLVYLAVAAALGALTGPAALLALPVAVLTGVGFAALLVAYSATLETDRSYAAIYRFVVLPMALFAGTFFPVDTLPAALRPVAWLTPLWHGTELARGVTFGGLDLLPAVGHLAYLVAVLVAGVWLSARNFRKRLGV
jgi:lipooligosaccharide transport system permease protein